MSSEFSSSQRGMIVGEEINKTLLNSVSDRVDLSADWCGGGGGIAEFFLKRSVEKRKVDNLKTNKNVVYAHHFDLIWMLIKRRFKILISLFLVP